MSDGLTLPPRFRFKGALNLQFEAIQDGDEIVATFGPFPVGYPLSHLLVQFNSRVALNQGELVLDCVWSEKPWSRNNTFPQPAPNTMESLFGKAPGETATRLTLIPPTTGSSSRVFAIYQPVPASFPYVLLRVSATNETMDAQISLIPGPFSFTE